MTKSRGIREMHGAHKTRAYRVWAGMRTRCNNPNNPAYPRYGGRGIIVCDRWMKFSNFVADMGHPPGGMTLERKDNNKGYSPTNCIWADRKTQGRNKSNNFLLTIDGETHPVSVWAERAGIKYQTIHRRLVTGWSAAEAVRTPLVTRRKGIPRGMRIAGFSADITVQTKNGPIPLWKAIEVSGLRHTSVMQRIRRGWSAEAALSLSPRKGPRREAWGTIT